MIRSERNSEPLESLFRPRSIAVLGASAAEGKLGNQVVLNLKAGFPGRLYPVNPAAREIEGLPVYPSVAALPEAVDLVVAFVPGERLLSLVEDFPEGAARFLLAIPSGFAEASKEGAAAQERLAAAARERGLRVVGPNTMGILNCPYGLNASLIPGSPPAGRGLSLVTQSGGFGMGAWMYARNHELPIAKICDVGNTSDVDMPEVLAYLRSDDESAAVGIYLESVVRPDDFCREAAALARTKPVVLTKLSRSEAGVRASFAHLGLPARELDGIEGVLQAATGVELLNTAKALIRQPRPRGRRVGIVTGTGGIGAELTDLAVEHGFEVPELSRGVQEAIAPHLPAYAGRRNPIDTTPVWWQFREVYPALVRALDESGEVDLLLVSITDVPTLIEQFVDAMVEFAGTRAAGASAKPLYVFWNSLHEGLENMKRLERAGLPCYLSPLETVRAAAAALGT